MKQMIINFWATSPRHGISTKSKHDHAKKSEENNGSEKLAHYINYQISNQVNEKYRSVDASFDPVFVEILSQSCS